MAGKSSKRQRVYYAHARCTYGDPDEGHDLQRIRTELPRISIVNPAKYEGDPLKQADTMGFCFNLIEGCDMVVFTRLMGKITSGVGKEINHALGLGKPVFELSEDLLSPCTRKVAYISINATISLYGKYRRRLRNRRIRELQRQIGELRKSLRQTPPK
jgi:hypothetical protein